MKGTYFAVVPTGQLSEVEFDTGRFGPPRGRAETFLVPGFVDLHIHGAFGVDFMSARRADLLEMMDALSAIGYEALLPTTVTASAGAVARALTELPEHPMVAGFHLEGPFISPKYPGAQPPSAIVDPPVGATTWDPILDDPRLRLVTLAPERPNAVDLTARLAAKGVRVSMGHTAATYAEAMEGHRAGVVHATHTYNAMRGLHHREPGALGFVLDTDGVDAELIYDRKHVAREAASVLLRCKGADRVIAVSDSTLASGTAPGRRVQMWDLEAIVGEGEVRLADGTLAGSAITLLDAFRNLLADFGPEVAIKACSINPRRALGLGEPRVWLEIDRQGRILTIWRSDR